jgi:autotransporter-associated beta strand protein
MDGPITVSSGSLVLADQATVGLGADHRGGLTVAAGAEFVARGTLPQTLGGGLGGSGRVTVDGGRLVLAGASSFTGTAAVAAGELLLANPAALAAARATVGPAGRLAVGTTSRAAVGRLELAPGGIVDVAGGGLTIGAGTSSAALVAALVVGRGDGTWNGSAGITSTAVAADVAAGLPRAVGWIDNGDGSLTAAYAALGDTNVDGGIDILDAANFFAGGAFDTGRAAAWAAGDFGYDGIVDILDAADFISTGLYDSGPYAGGAPASLAVVPEPIAAWPWAAVACAAAIMTWRRRRC